MLVPVFDDELSNILLVAGHLPVFTESGEGLGGGERVTQDGDGPDGGEVGYSVLLYQGAEGGDNVTKRFQYVSYLLLIAHSLIQ